MICNFKTHGIMKFKIFFILALIFSGTIYSQETEENNKNFNEIGIELTGILDGQYQLFYERSISNNWSLGMGVGYKSDTGIINISGIDSPHIKTEDVNYSGFKIIGEGRYYIKGINDNGMTGFYVGAFAKHSNFNSDILGTYTDEDEVIFALDLTGDFSITSFGGLVGYKLSVWECFNIDFLIAGLGVGFYNFEVKINKDLPDSFIENLNDALENYNIFDYVDGDFDFKVSNAKTNFTGPSFRYAIKLNYEI